MIPETTPVQQMCRMLIAIVYATVSPNILMLFRNSARSLAASSRLYSSSGFTSAESDG